MRNYKRKINIGNTNAGVMLQAAKKVKLEGFSIRKAAIDYQIPYSTLRRYCKKFTDEDINCNNPNPSKTDVGYIQNKKVYISSNYFSARVLITTENSLREIVDTHKKELRGDSTSLISAKLSKLRQNNKDLVGYASEMEKLTESLQAAYLAEGMPVHLAMKYTTEAAVKSLLDNAASERMKTVIAAGNFTTPQEVMTKLVSINVGNNQSTER